MVAVLVSKQHSDYYQLRKFGVFNFFKNLIILAFQGTYPEKPLLALSCFSDKTRRDDTQQAATEEFSRSIGKGVFPYSNSKSLHRFSFKIRGAGSEILTEKGRTISRPNPISVRRRSQAVDLIAAFIPFLKGFFKFAEFSDRAFKDDFPSFQFSDEIHDPVKQVGFALLTTSNSIIETVLLRRNCEGFSIGVK